MVKQLVINKIKSTYMYMYVHVYRVKKALIEYYSLTNGKAISNK